MLSKLSFALGMNQSFVLFRPLKERQNNTEIYGVDFYVTFSTIPMYGYEALSIVLGSFIKIRYTSAFKKKYI